MKRFAAHSRPLRSRCGVRALLVPMVAVCLATPLAAAQMVPAPFDPISIGGPDPAERFKDISIEQHLNAQVPLDLVFLDELGDPVRIGDFVGDRPAILSLVYYQCPMLCNLVLAGVENVIAAVKYNIGSDFDVITVSIDPGETPDLAARKKANHIERLGREGAEQGWHFLTGDEVAIERLAHAVGFRYIYDPATDQYAHAAGIMVLTPQGRVARYYYGIEYIARDVGFGLAEASEGRIGNVVDQLLLLCFAYDPSTGKYGFYIMGAMRIIATLMILGLVAMYTLFYFTSKRAKNNPHDGGGAVPGNPADTTR